MEQADRLPITDFYSTPATLHSSKPGDLLRKEAFSRLLPAQGRDRGAHSVSLVGCNRTRCRDLGSGVDTGGTAAAAAAGP